MATIEYFKGFDTYAIYGEETVFGTPVAPVVTSRIGRVKSVNFTMTNNFFRTQGMGEGRNVTGTFTGPFDCSGTIEWEVDDFTFMQYAIGDRAGTGTLADPFELQERDNIGYDATNIPTLSIEIGSQGDTQDDVTTFDGCVLNSFTLTATQGETLKASAEIIARSVATSTTLETYTAPTTRVFVFHEGNVTIGADTLHCSAFELTISNNIETHRRLGTRFIQLPTTGMRKYDFSITLRKKFDDTASILSGTELRAYFFGAATAPATAAVITAYQVNLNLNEGTGASGDRVVNINLATCYFESWSEPIALEGGVIEVTVTGFGQQGLADGANNVPIRYYTVA